jgi:hypothetical protein
LSQLNDFSTKFALPKPKPVRDSKPGNQPVPDDSQQIHLYCACTILRQDPQSVPRAWRAGLCDQ